MKRELVLYYIGITIFFTALLFSIRYVVNTTRLFIGYEEGFNPIQIKWRLDESDSTLRIEDPLYVTKDYYLIKYNDYQFIKNDSVLNRELLGDSLKSKGNFLNLTPPFYVWKEPKNDTLKVFKNGITLKFTKNYFLRK